MSEFDYCQLAQLATSLQRDLEHRDQKIQSLQKSIADDEKRLREMNHNRILAEANLHVVRQMQFLQTCIPDELWSIRQKAHDLNIEAQRDDITVARQRELREEIHQQKKALQKRCHHPLVVYSDGYEGSSSWDYDDARHGQHACIICGLTTYDDDYKGHASTFPHNETRLANRLYNDLEPMEYVKRRDFTLTKRVAQYLAMSLDELKETFFGERRFRRVRKLLGSSNA